ncbi:uncharacterized protein Z520_10664 [Fonsecaea multimorphosa CBS 102226]|uniref:Uncharacterized protein n=1 Tax=Fonsecaea multimorphosa CBS 102226 TaxID=1442371 RepID=A0A0D2KB16_9EURO|nr:uncharacterized protein Z520_10664 [Fonsecaea multimorphosa CBS 102226]KIX93758.1 hypothetical protein Z520_10664 [Fonsecaea multimorphosa CBS 102226]OAL19864.1 hypothetical protein AYO22_09391 [Fonsecaea multimorphosa]
MATPPRLPSLSPERSQSASREEDELALRNMLAQRNPGGLERLRSRALSEITLVEPPPLYDINQIDGAGGRPERTTRTVRFQVDEDNQARVQKSLWRRVIQPILLAIATRFIFLVYFSLNATLLIRIAVMASHNKHMQYNEALLWAWVQFVMLGFLLLRSLGQGFMYSPTGTPHGLKILVAIAGISLLGVGLGAFPLFLI